MMDGNQDEADMMRFVKDYDQGFAGTALENDKKSFFWMGGMLDCFTSVLSLFSSADTKPPKVDNWEVPFEAITDLKYLGCGAQGMVYSGILHGEMIAVKKLRSRSETNIKHLRKLNHDNIVRFRGVCTASPYCVIMEYCQYGPLFEYLHSGVCFAPKKIMKWAKEIALGMAYLHSHRIIHRDLKSPNILIADNLVVKVSDFGTCREWNDVSTVMSFIGTVAWMAPEMIRQEPCSERVDVWSYGVVLWELLTQEIPYKNMETNAIMWGVGTESIILPVPTSCPESLQQLLNQCWNRVPKNRPPFKIIAANLEIIADHFASLRVDCFSRLQSDWRREIQVGMDKFYAREQEPVTQEVSMQRREEIKHARDLRQVYERYEQRMLRANDMYMEACAVKLQLEQRERAVSQREMALKSCRCNYRKNIKLYQRQASTSSDNQQVPVHVSPERRRKKKATSPTHVVVSYVDPASSKTVSEVVPATHMSCLCKSVGNNNTGIEMKETVVEQNGNIDIKRPKCLLDNDNRKPDVVQV